MLPVHLDSTTLMPWLTGMVLVSGLVVGSFLNVCIFRLPEGTFFKHVRSVCPACGATVPSWLNVPVLSYLFLRGRARCCGASLSVQYPLVELVTAILFVLAYDQFPFMTLVSADASMVQDATAGSGYPESAFVLVNQAQLVRWLHAVVLLSVLLTASVIDFRLMIIPDVLSIGLIVSAPVVVWLHPELTWKSSLLGVLLGGGILYAVAWGYWLLRREVGMGFGDVKLLAGIGGWLGYEAIFPVILIASLSGSFVGIGVMIWKRQFGAKMPLPFGPFLAFGAVLHLLFSQEIRELWISMRI